METRTLLQGWCKVSQLCGKQQAGPQMINQMTEGPAIPLLGPHTRVANGDSDTHVPVCPAALVTITERWKQTKRPPTMNGKTKRGPSSPWNITQL